MEAVARIHSITSVDGIQSDNVHSVEDVQSVQSIMNKPKIKVSKIKPKLTQHQYLMEIRISRGLFPNPRADESASECMRLAEEAFSAPDSFFHHKRYQCGKIEIISNEGSAISSKVFPLTEIEYVFAQRPCIETICVTNVIAMRSTSNDQQRVSRFRS